MPCPKAGGSLRGHLIARLQDQELLQLDSSSLRLLELYVIAGRAAMAIDT
jgi:hypothetical protein